MNINITNSRKRDATVTVSGLSSSFNVRWVDTEGRQASNHKVQKGTLDRDIETSEESVGCRTPVVQAHIDGDPKIDLESYESFLKVRCWKPVQ